MKRNDLKEISENEFVAVLGMMDNEHFLVDLDKYELGEQVDSDFERYKMFSKELITDKTGQAFYLLDFTIIPDIKSEYADFDPYDSGWCNVLQSFQVDFIELFDLEENRIDTTAEQRLKIATIIQERLTIKN
jgi:hypothetical protein